VDRRRGVLFAVALNQPIVNGAHEARPYTVHPHILVLAHRSTDLPFPSDYGVMAGAAAALWLLLAIPLTRLVERLAATVLRTLLVDNRRTPVDAAAGATRGRRRVPA
jgi:peptidoglycan/LPS O-acetylase OafA/YrhL